MSRAATEPVHKSPAERALHATLYEFIAILICAPLLAWLMDTPVADMGALTVAISAIALAWNVIFNAGFDRLRRRLGFAMTLKNRVWHGLAFEGGLVLFTVPLAAWWLSIGLWQAFLLDASILLFFLPYTVIFNWAYDSVRTQLTRDCMDPV